LSRPSFKTPEYQLIALSMVFRILDQINQFANTGKLNQDALEAMIQSLFVFDADSPAEIYPATTFNKHPGADMHSILNGRFDQQTRPLVNYCIALNRLAKLFLSNHELQSVVKTGLFNIFNKF